VKALLMDGDCAQSWRRAKPPFVHEGALFVHQNAHHAVRNLAKMKSLPITQ
jgi:hypothetical protein